MRKTLFIAWPLWGLVVTLGFAVLYVTTGDSVLFAFWLVLFLAAVLLFGIAFWTRGLVH